MVLRHRGGSRALHPIPLAAGGLSHNTEVSRAFLAVSQACPEPAADLSNLYLQAQCFLLPGDTGICTGNIEQDLQVAARVLAEGSADRVEAMDKFLARQAQVAQKYIDQHAETRASRHYVRGLLLAVGFSIVLLGAIAVIAYSVLQIIYRRNVPDDISLAVYQTLAGIGGGAAGAVVSVLLRQRVGIAFADDSSLTRVAVIRVVLGWFFAAAVMFLIRGGIIQIVKVPDVNVGDVNDHDVPAWFFWGGIGFLAGFNERWVRQLISREPTKETKETDSP